MCTGGEELLTAAEVAARLKWSRKTLQNRMSEGVFRLGVHYLKRKGIGKRFKWAAIQAWLENNDPTENEGVIRMARGYSIPNFLTPGTKKHIHHDSNGM